MTTAGMAAAAAAAAEGMVIAAEGTAVAGLEGVVEDGCSLVGLRIAAEVGHRASL